MGHRRGSFCLLLVIIQILHRTDVSIRPALVMNALAALVAEDGKVPITNAIDVLHGTDFIRVGFPIILVQRPIQR